MVDLETYKKVVMYQYIAKPCCLGHLQCIFLEKNQLFHFLGSLFYKNANISKNVWFFSRTTTRDRKLKFGMNDPYNMFFEIGYPFGNILFRFWAMWIFVSLLPQNAPKTGVFSHIWVVARQKITLCKNEIRYHQMDSPFLKNIL